MTIARDTLIANLSSPSLMADIEAVEEEASQKAVSATLSDLRERVTTELLPKASKGWIRYEDVMSLFAEKEATHG